MTIKSAEEADQLQVIGLFDNLLNEVYELVLQEIKSNPPKLGDFLKMFEMRLKSTPPSTRHKKFWQLLEEIRQNTRPLTGETTADGKTTVKKETTK